MAERRLSLSRQRRALHLLGGFLVVALLWYVGPRVLRRFDFFRIRRVEITGLRYLAPATVTKALELDARSSVFDDLTGAAQRLRKLPGIQAASLRSRLPGTLEVVVQEAMPVALTPVSIGLALLD